MHIFLFGHLKLEAQRQLTHPDPVCIQVMPQVLPGFYISPAQV